MRVSRFFISTLKEAPSDAEVVSHRLMLRAGLIKRLTSGVYTWMPLGLRVLRRVEAINRTSGEIRAGDLQRRVPVSSKGDEFDQLALNLNAMLDQIERLLQGMREVTDNVAHDLRTPLNRLRTRLEVALIAELDQAELRAVLEETLADAEAMIGTFNALLEIASAEAGSDRAAFEPVDLAALTGDLAELYEPLAEDKDLAFERACPPGVAVDLSIDAGFGSELEGTRIGVRAIAESTVSGAQSISLVIGGAGLTPGDFVASHATLEFPDEAAYADASITVLDDAQTEGSEIASLILASPSAGLRLGGDIHRTIVLADDDGCGFAATPIHAIQGSDGSRSALPRR